MASFTPAFEATMKHEDPKLSGIVTKDPSRAHPDAIARFGINSGAWPEAVTAGFYTMPVSAALEWAATFYKYKFFSPIGGYQITDQPVTNKFFDLAVNEGISEATKIVQRAINKTGSLELFFLNVDGKPGMRTIDAINRCMPGRLLAEIKAYAVDFYNDLVRADAALKPDLEGWITRANS